MTRPVANAIDVHAHAIIPGVDDFVAREDPEGMAAHRELEARRQGPDSAAVSRAMIIDRLPRLLDLERRIADMDAARVARQLVSPSPSHYYPFADRATSDASARRVNEGIRDLVARRPDRLTGLGVAPLQHPEVALAALDHAVAGCGLAGVEIPSTAGDVELSDERLEPFWARAAELEAIIFLHPFGCSLDERLDRYYLTNIVGQPVENAVALSHLVFSGVLDRHPGLRLIAAHGGGYLPTYLGRSDHGWHARPDARGCAHPPSTYLRRLHFDSLVFDAPSLRALIGVAGADRVLLGSDYPFDMGVEDPVDRVELAGLDAAVTRAVLAGNATTLGL